MAGLSTAVWKRQYYIISLIIFCCLALHGQELQPYFHHLSKENSKLSQGQNTFVFKDSHGFIWISSTEGLNRYDSREVQSYRAPKHLTHNYITGNCYEDKNTNIWFSTYTSITCYLRKEDRFVSFQLTTTSGDTLVEDYYVFHLDNKNQLWTRIKDTLHLFDIQTNKQKKFDYLNGTRTAVLENNHGDVKLLVSSFEQNGIDIYKVEKEKLYKRSYLTKIKTYYTYPESDTLIWVATDKGLLAFNPVYNTTKVYNQFKSNTFGVFDIAPYGNEYLLVSAGKQGILLFNKTLHHFVAQYQSEEGKPGSLRSNGVQELYLDRDHVLWSTIQSVGLDFAALRKNRFPLQLRSAEPNRSDNTLSILEDHLQQVWVSTTQGVYVFDAKKKTKAFFEYQQLIGGAPSSAQGYLSLNPQGSVWLTMIDRIIRFEPSDLSYKTILTTPDYSLWQLYFLSNGQALLTDYDHSLLQLSADFKISPNLDFSIPTSDFVTKIFEYPSTGYLFLAMNANKLRVFQKKNNRWDNVTIFNNFGDVTALLPTSKPTIYWVTTSQGLARIDLANRQVRSFSEQDGFESQLYYAILEDVTTGTLWLSTNNGIGMYDPIGKKSQSYNQTDGLQSAEFTRSVSLKDASGHFWFGGIKGVNVFKPNLIKPLADTPGCELIQVFVNDQVFDWQQKPLQYSQNTISFQFRVLDFANPNAPHHLRYKLESYDNQFVEATDDQIIRYAKLPPGRYTLRVDVANADGVWFENRYKLPIRVKPPFWMQWWFILPAILLLIFVGWRFYQADLKQRLQKMENQRLRELDTFKTRFFTNITHEFRTPLTLILGPVSNALKNGKVLYENDLQLVKKYGQRLLAMITQILDLNKLDAGKMQVQYVQNDIVAYIRYLVESFESWAVQKDIELAFEREADSLWMDFDSEKLAQIVSNLLSNAIKYTEVGGHIKVIIKNTDQALELSVADTGIGIQEADLSNIFNRFHQIPSTTRGQQGTGIGLALTKELVTLLDGHIRVESVLGKGSIFKIQLPITHKAPVADFEPMPVESTPDLYESAALLPPKSPSVLASTVLPLVLVIEDNADVASYIARCLQPAYELSLAANGMEGIQKAVETLPDLIISDVMMPEKDGFEVCDALKNNPITEHIPIILLTAKVDIPSQLEGFKKGADAYLTKPFDQAELTIQIKRLLRLRQRLQQHYLRQAGIDEASSLYPIFAQKEPPLVSQIRTWVEKKLDEKVDITIDALCKEVGLNQSQLNRQLNHLIDMPPKRFIQLLKLKKAKYLLRHSDLLISEIAYESGFEDPTHFNRTFRQEEGFTPKEYKEKTTKG